MTGVPLGGARLLLNSWFPQGLGWVAALRVIGPNHSPSRWSQGVPNWRVARQGQRLGAQFGLISPSSPRRLAPACVIRWFGSLAPPF
jgi:hypothetical protein